MHIKSVISTVHSFFKKNWMHILYFVAVLYCVSKFNKIKAARNLTGLLLVIGYFVLFIIIKYVIYKKKLVLRYLLGAICFGYHIFLLFHFKITGSLIRETTFNVIIIYAYIFCDIISPFVMVGILWYAFSILVKSPSPQLARSLRFGTLTPTIGYVAAFAFFRQMTKEKNLYQKMSIMDSLTQTFTLPHIIELGNAILKKRKDITVVVIDLDNFKQLNDNFGHLAGNNILKEVATLLKDHTEETGGYIGRIGGDEFVILLKDEDHVDVNKFIDELYTAIHTKLYEVDPDIDSVQLSFSFGISRKVDLSEVDMMDKLLYNADINMYYNKYRSKRSVLSHKATDYFLPPKINHFLNVLAEKDMYTYVHSEHVAKYSAGLARQMGFSQNQIVEMYIAGWLHDIGKSLVTNNILRKSGRLSDEEYELVKEHIEIGLNIISKLDISDTILNGIKYHHEHWDGTGYPFSISGTDIPLEGRLIKVVDSYSAMCIKRVYRQSLSRTQAIQELKKHKGVYFDPEIVNQFEQFILNKDKKNILLTIDEWVSKGNYRLKLVEG